jgi:hypothetical protein
MTKPETKLLVEVTFQGVLTHDDFRQLLRHRAREIDRFDTAHLLIVLDGFEGWESGWESDDLDFLIKYDAKIKKIAVVGDARWHDLWQMFLGAGLREASVEFFAAEKEQEARTWLEC